LVLWQHFCKNTTAVEYFLDLKVTRYDESTIIQLQSVTEEGETERGAKAGSKRQQHTANHRPLTTFDLLIVDLSPSILEALYEAKCSNLSPRARRASLNGEIQISLHQFGRSFFTFSGQIAEDTELGSRKATAKSAMKAGVLRSRSNGISRDRAIFQGRKMKSATIELAYASIKGILEETKIQFHNPDIIDERIRREFVEKIPHAPPLTEQEKGMFQGLGGLEMEVEEKGKRVRGTAHNAIDKFLWNDGDLWGAFSCQVDISAEKMLAYLYELGTYEGERRIERSDSNISPTTTNNLAPPLPQQSRSTRDETATFSDR